MAITLQHLNFFIVKYKVKTDIKKEAYSSFDNYNFWNELNISKEEFLAIKDLSLVIKILFYKRRIRVTQLFQLRRQIILKQ